MIKLGITRAIIDAKPTEGEITTAVLVVAVRSDKQPGTNEEVALLNKALKDLGAIDFDTDEDTDDITTLNDTISYAESAVYDSVMIELKNAALKGVAPIQAIKNLGGIESEGVLLAVRDWLNEVTQ
nr:MAG TPA: hypothetical protein [Caudoviricetes sp.]